MMLKNPRFWQYRTSFLSVLLVPLACLYQFCYFIRQKFSTPYKANIPIICVGNITIGGAGKTPCAIAIAKELQKNNFNVAFLSRGYGGLMQGPTKISSSHNIQETGDEPLLLAKTAPTVIAKNKLAGIKLLEKQNFDVIIMDDGIQNPSIYKDICIAVIDGIYGLGNYRTLPAGPLRQTVKNALKNTNCICLIGQDKHKLGQLKPEITINAFLQPKFNSSLLKHKFIAFAGIATPEKFYLTLTEAGFNIIDHFSFPDHYPYKEKDMEKLILAANKTNARLITTEKDFTRIPDKYKEQISILPISLEFTNNEKLKQLLNKIKPQS